jgi:broad specificity phosphatase PhoE
MPVERLIIMRHGETADVAPLIISPPDTPTGNLADTRLSDNGFAQARDTGDELLHKDKPIDVIYSSPSWQSLDTVRVTLRQQCLSSVKYPKLLKVRVEPGLRYAISLFR